MNAIKTLLLLIGIGCLLSYTYSCQSINSQDQKIVPQVSEQLVSVEAFKQMSPAQQWAVISPMRRNQLRDLHLNQKKPLPIYLQQLVEKFPKMETAPIKQQSKTATDKAVTQEKKAALLQEKMEWSEQHFTSEIRQLMHMNPTEQWATFSENRKTYMRKHPKHYPAFKEFLN